MKELNIIIKGFELNFGRHILEQAFTGIDVGYCASILNFQSDMPDMHATYHEWYPAAALRMEDGKDGYAIDWNAVRPLDEALIQEMREVEAVVLDMLARFERKKYLSYEQRKRIYLQHLRYWNHVIEERQINLFLCGHIPHQCFDNVIDALCKRKGIPTLFFHPTIMPDAMAFMTSWEESDIRIAQRYEAYKKTDLETPNGVVQLSSRCEEYFEKHTNPTKKPTPDHIGVHALHTSNRRLIDWLQIGCTFLCRKPVQFFTEAFSLSFWRRQYLQHAAYTLYNRHAISPDFTKKYVYVALHVQPECSTSPMAGAFVDQLLIVQMLAALLPKDVLLYVKEHPNQRERCRSVQWYKDLLAVSNLRFVSRDTNTFDLIGNAIAVVTATGTVGFEALFREKPVLMFGHHFHQYAPGVFCIHSVADCKAAIEAIFAGFTPNLRDLRLFLKAFEDEDVEGYLSKLFQSITRISEKQNIENIAAFLREKLHALSV